MNRLWRVLREATRRRRSIFEIVAEHAVRMALVLLTVYFCALSARDERLLRWFIPFCLTVYAFFGLMMLVAVAASTDGPSQGRRVGVAAFILAIGALPWFLVFSLFWSRLSTWPAVGWTCPALIASGVIAMILAGRQKASGEPAAEPS